MILPLLRGRWRGAPDEVVDVNDRPIIRHSGFAAGEGFWSGAYYGISRGNVHCLPPCGEGSSERSELKDEGKDRSH